MPIYEYQCGKCGHQLEALQKLSDKPLRECPECGRHTLKRLMSAPLFRLAGSGWYETDFKSDKEQKRNLVEKGDAEPARAESKDDSKTSTTDVKPDAKVDSKPESKSDSKPESKSEPRSDTRPDGAAGGTAQRRASSRPTAKSAARVPSRRKAPARARRR